MRNVDDIDYVTIYTANYNTALASYTTGYNLASKSPLKLAIYFYLRQLGATRRFAFKVWLDEVIRCVRKSLRT